MAPAWRRRRRRATWLDASPRAACPGRVNARSLAFSRSPPRSPSYCCRGCRRYWHLPTASSCVAVALITGARLRFPYCSTWRLQCPLFSRTERNPRTYANVPTYVRNRRRTWSVHEVRAKPVFAYAAKSAYVCECASVRAGRGHRRTCSINEARAEQSFVIQAHNEVQRARVWSSFEPHARRGAGGNDWARHCRPSGFPDLAP